MLLERRWRSVDQDDKCLFYGILWILKRRAMGAFVDICP